MKSILFSSKGGGESEENNEINLCSYILRVFMETKTTIQLVISVHGTTIADISIIKYFLPYRR